MGLSLGLAILSQQPPPGPNRLICSLSLGSVCLEHSFLFGALLTFSSQLPLVPLRVSWQPQELRWGSGVYVGTSRGSGGGYPSKGMRSLPLSKDGGKQGTALTPVSVSQAPDEFLLFVPMVFTKGAQGWCVPPGLCEMVMHCTTSKGALFTSETTLICMWIMTAFWKLKVLCPKGQAFFSNSHKDTTWDKMVVQVPGPIWKPSSSFQAPFPSP